MEQNEYPVGDSARDTSADDVKSFGRRNLEQAHASFASRSPIQSGSDRFLVGELRSYAREPRSASDAIHEPRGASWSKHPVSYPPHPSSSAVLVMSILGLIAIILFRGVLLFLFLFGLLSVISWRMGAAAQREIDRGARYDLTIVRAGKIIGLIGSIIWLLLLLLWLWIMTNSSSGVY